jgi:hypothetical protein
MYYEVFVSSQRYHGGAALTYMSDQPLQRGMVVLVPLQKELVLGIVAGKGPRPKFATKPIHKIIVDTPLPPQLLDLQA